MKDPFQIIPFGEEFLEAAATLFIHNLKKQRQAVPVLPSQLEELPRVVDLLGRLFRSSPGLAAVQDGQLLGYMGWFYIDGFRETRQRGAYSPEWGHSAEEKSCFSTYQALYRAASAQWASTGCAVHALTLLAFDKPLAEFWFWNGFGLCVVDAIRPVQPLGMPYPENLVIRQARMEDVQAIAGLEVDHWRHYAQPPVLMVPQTPADAAGYQAFLSKTPNSVWLAMDSKEAIGYMRFEGQSFGAAHIVQSETTIAITAAYVRPNYRGQKAAPAMLDAALQDYKLKGFERCSVDFESFNPEAANFWMRYFAPVCLSVTRHPEA
jgi:GNAT superfamily N-acetyltransferase